MCRACKEIIVVDGGSNDRSIELARRHKVRLYHTISDLGRGAAVRLGFTKARGNIVAIFPADGEYSASDLPSVFLPILNNQFRVVIGSRAVKCLDQDKRTRYIYEGAPFLYYASKYGGIFLSILCLFMYNRFITDPLSTLKAYDRTLLDGLDLKSNGVDLEAEIIAKVSRQREFILEVPVSYIPRTRAQGKKTKFRDGIAAIIALLKYRRNKVVSDRNRPVRR